MRSMRTPFLPLLALLVIGCASRPPAALGSFHGECPRRENWLAQVAVRRAERMEPALADAQQAGLAIQARVKADTTDSVLVDAQLRVFRGDRELPANLVATGTVDRSGWFTVDTPAPLAAYVHARWFGYVPRGEPIPLRAGYRDTVIVHLRYDVVCLSS